MKILKALLAIALVAIVGISALAIAQSSSHTQAAPAQKQLNQTVNEQFPNYTGSIAIPENYSDDNLSSLAKISPAQATSIVLSNASFASGKVLNVTLENENGYLVYSVEVLVNNVTYQVKVDAGNGKILWVETSTDTNAMEEVASEENQ